MLRFTLALQATAGIISGAYASPLQTRDNGTMVTGFDQVCVNDVILCIPRLM
jgi:hypothetical protein